MGKDEINAYDEKDKKMRNERKGNFDKMDDKMKEFMNSSKYENMSDEDKKKMMSMYMFQMGSNMQ